MIATAGLRPAALSVWGDLYVAFARLFSRWRVVAVVAMVLAILSALFVRLVKHDETAVAFSQQLLGLFLSFIVAILPLPVNSTLVLPAGRRERLSGMMAIAIVAAVLLAVFLAGVANVTLGLQALSPRLFGHASGLSLLGPLVFVPLVLTFRLLFRSRVMRWLIPTVGLAWTFVPLIVLLLTLALTPWPAVQSAILDAVFSTFFVLMTSVLEALFTPEPLPSLVLAVVGWSAFLFLAHRICAKKSLGKLRAGVTL